MPKKIGSVTRQVLVNATLPAATQTYTVISHQFVIDTVMEQLQNNGFSVEKELYKCTGGAQVASGLFKLTYGDDPDLSLMYAFGNSYDKTMKFKSAIGAYVNQNDAVMISRFNDWTRKHTGSADEETVQTIKTQVEAAKEYFDELKTQKDMMSQITVSRIEFASLVGQLYFLKFITADQISIVLKEYDNPTYTYTLPDDNLWTCYNHILIALKRTHPKNWIDNQIAVHLHICNTYKLFDYDKEEEVDDILDVTEVDEDTVEESLESIDPKLTTIEEESTIEEVVLPGFDNTYTPDNEEEINNRMDIIGQNGNEGLHYGEETADEVIEETPIVKAKDTKLFPLEEEDEIQRVISEGAEVMMQGTPSTMQEEMSTDEIVATVIDKTLNPEPAGDEDFVDGVDEVIEEPVTTEEPVQAETFYFMKEDYEGVEVGDYIEEANVYYEIINDESGDDGNFWICVEVDVAVDETEEQVTEPTPEIMAEINAAEAAVAEVCDEEEELPAELEAIVEDMEVNANTQYQDPALKEVIKSELSFLYDYDDIEFIYELVDGQYNITLVSGETCSFAQSYIEQQV